MGLFFPGTSAIKWIKWLRTASMLSHYDSKDRNKTYREMTQKTFPGRKKNMGRFSARPFFCSLKFVDDIKPKYLSEKPDGNIPQKRHVFRDTNPKTIFGEAAKILRFSTNDFLESAWIYDADQYNRDLLIFLLWSTEWYNNQEIGNLFGTGHSSISRRVTIMKLKTSKDDEIHKR